MALAKNTMNSIWENTTAWMYLDQPTVRVRRAILTTAMAKWTRTLTANRILRVRSVPNEVAKGWLKKGR